MLPGPKKAPIDSAPNTRAALAAALAATLLAALALALLASPARAGLLEPSGKKVWFGVSDTGDPAAFGQFSSAVGHHPAVIESFRTWGSDFPDSIVRWQTARARPMIHITTADSHDGHELLIAAGDRPRQGRRLPGPPQQGLRQQAHARLRAAAGRAQPLPQRLRLLRLRRPPARPRPPAALVQARLPPHLRDRPRRRHAPQDQPPAAGSRPAAAHLPRPRPEEGAGGDRLEPAAGRLADQAVQPPALLLARASAGSTGPAPTSTPATRNGRR